MRSRIAVVVVAGIATIGFAFGGLRYATAGTAPAPGAVQVAAGTGFEASTDTLVMRPSAADPDVRTGTLTVHVTARADNPSLAVIRVIVRGLTPPMTATAPCETFKGAQLCDVAPPPPGATRTYSFGYRLDQDEFVPQGDPSVEVVSLTALPQNPNDGSHIAEITVQVP